MALGGVAQFLPWWLRSFLGSWRLFIFLKKKKRQRKKSKAKGMAKWALWFWFMGPNALWFRFIGAFCVAPGSRKHSA